MKFSKLAEYLQKLENTSKRLVITDILTDLIRELPKDEVGHGLYLSLGYLEAPYRSVKFNIAEKMLIKILMLAYDKSESEIKKAYAKLGDLGSVAYEISPKSKKSSPEISEVYTNLMVIAKYEGSGSQEQKISEAAKLFSRTDSLSTKYLARIILGNLRLGFTSITVIDALANLLNDKLLKEKIERKYNIHPDIGLVARKIKEKGISGIKDIQIEVGVPILAQKAQALASPEEILEKIKNVWAEYKFDGTRVQLHLDRSKKMEIESFEQQGFFDVQKDMIFIKTYTRNLEETTYQYPDIIEAANKQIDAQSVILDGEAVGVDTQTGEFLPFQDIMQRKRKHGVTAMAKEVPLKYFVFDLLFLNGKSLLNEPLEKRREYLDKVIKKGEVIIIDEYLQTTEVAKLTDYFAKAKEKGLEGIMAKKPDSHYEAGARAFSWVKFKKTEEQTLADTIECVVMGYYHGKGVRAKFGIGKFLVGIFDSKDNKYKTITKVGSGLKDEEWEEKKKQADTIKVSEKPKDFEVNKKFEADVWVKPKIVMEIASNEISKSSDHSTGYALRFPRLVRFRDDKGPEDTTSPKEIRDLYNAQKRGRV